jgi:hypothetical protein
VSAENTPDSLSAFWAHLPGGDYLHVPTGALWPAKSVDQSIRPWPADPENPEQRIKPSAWLSRYRAIHQRTWHPGREPVVQDELVGDGGWYPHMGARVFNTYRAPHRNKGEGGRARPWLQHLQKLYPQEWKHILLYLAHRIQRPGEKINHALVLGGPTRIGKDTLLEPVKAGVGHWNWAESSQSEILGSQFNPYAKSVVLRISEARDHGPDRFKFYEATKTLIAAPPDVLMVNEKHARPYAVPNVCSVIFTTNNRSDGLYLPLDDARHFVAWSPVDNSAFSEGYFAELHSWLHSGGAWDVVDMLAQEDLRSFRPKTIPEKTEAFWTMAQSGSAPEDADLATVLDLMKQPSVVTIHGIASRAVVEGMTDLCEELRGRNRRALPHRLARCGYVLVRNPEATDGLWRVEGHRRAVYGREQIPREELVSAARRFASLPL